MSTAKTDPDAEVAFLRRLANQLGVDELSEQALAKSLGIDGLTDEKLEQWFAELVHRRAHERDEPAPTVVQTDRKAAGPSLAPAGNARRKQRDR